MLHLGLSRGTGVIRWPWQRPDAVRDQEAEAQAEAGRVRAQRRQVIAAAEANLWTARHEWQRDQTAGGLEGWGLRGERSEEERQWRRSRQEAPRVLSLSLSVPEPLSLRSHGVLHDRMRYAWTYARARTD